MDVTSNDVRLVTELTTLKKRRRVFVISGRNQKARDAVFAFLRSLRLEPEDYRQAMGHMHGAPKHTIDIVKAGLNRNHAVVVLLTPDDEARTRRNLRIERDRTTEGNWRVLRGQARPNVLFEAGMAVATHPRETVFVVMGNHRPIFSDLGGIHIVYLDNSDRKREDFRQWLMNAHCGVNPSSTSWRKAGDFDAALRLRKRKRRRKAQSREVIQHRRRYSTPRLEQIWGRDALKEARQHRRRYSTPRPEQLRGRDVYKTPGTRSHGFPPAP